MGQIKKEVNQHMLSIIEDNSLTMRSPNLGHCSYQTNYPTNSIGVIPYTYLLLILSIEDINPT